LGSRPLTYLLVGLFLEIKGLPTVKPLRAQEGKHISGPRADMKLAIAM